MVKRSGQIWPLFVSVLQVVFLRTLLAKKSFCDLTGPGRDNRTVFISCGMVAEKTERSNLRNDRYKSDYRCSSLRRTNPHWDYHWFARRIGKGIWSNDLLHSWFVPCPFEAVRRSLGPAEPVGVKKGSNRLGRTIVERKLFGLLSCLYFSLVRVLLDTIERISFIFAPKERS
jgi:hypothetical protein